MMLAMRKLFIITASFFAVFYVSCSKEQFIDTNSQVEERNNTVLSASLASVDVKTSLGEKSGTGTYPVFWTSTDEISVNGVASSNIDVLTPASSANFTMGGVLSAPYCAVYPSSAYVADSYNSVSHSMKVTVPAVQAYTENSFDPSAAILLGYSESSGAVAFKNAMAYLKITIQGGATEEKIKSIMVKSRGLKQISGEFDAVFTASGCSLNIPEGESHSTITLNCGDYGVEQGVPMIIAVPAQTYTSGLTIIVTDIRNRTMEVKSTKNIPLSEGSIYPTTIEYTTAPITFPVYFPLGYATDEIDGATMKSTTTSSYSHASVQTLWRPSKNSADDGIYIDNLQPQKGVFVSKSQEQATFKWHWVNELSAYRPEGKTYNPYIEFAGGGNGSSTLLAGPGVKGIWTGDYFEFDLPVKKIKAGTKIKFTFAVCTKNGPTFWEVKYKDGDIWKTTATANLPAYEGSDVKRTATWAIPYNSAPKMETIMTLDKAIPSGHLYVRVICADGSVISTGLNSVESDRLYPYGESINSFSSTNFYLCEKSADRNPGLEPDAWTNAVVDQTQTISFTIL